MFNHSHELIGPQRRDEQKARCLADAAEIFKALGDVTRLRILDVLEHRELKVQEIAAALDMTQSAISHQLGTLRTLRIVKARREGRSTFYSIDDGHVKQLFDLCVEHVAHG
ncbi:ArsR/SmtB family transcription factor [Methanocella sp. MCL-LM]|uniref:ArsR/SmtB family transcription factor n=1 Tax=Methanocella sp. MCL-LM TaxID=3412035 RepID=UPI003C78AA89